MIYSNAICDDRPMIICDDEEFISYWGSGYVCCDECVSIICARESWGEVYA